MGSGSTFGKIQINILVILLTDKDTEKENEQEIKGTGIKASMKIIKNKAQANNNLFQEKLTKVILKMTNKKKKIIN